MQIDGFINDVVSAIGSLICGLFVIALLWSFVGEFIKDFIKDICSMFSKKK